MPDAARARLGKSVVKFSLRTQSKKEARRLAEVHDVRWSARFSAAVVGTSSDAPIVEGVPLTGLLAERYVQEYVAGLDRLSAERLAVDPPADITERDEMVTDAEYSLQILKTPDDPRAGERVWEAARAVAKAAGAQLDENVTPYPVIAGIVLRGLMELDRRKLARLTHENGRQFFDQLFDLKAAPRVTFGELSRQYLALYDEDAAINGTSLKGSDKRHANVALVKNIVGTETLVADIDFDACLRFRSLLARVPTNWTKRYAGHTLQEAIMRSEGEKGQVLSAITQQQYLATFKDLIDLAVKKGLKASNPAQGLKPIKRDVVALRDKRKSLWPDQLEALFTSGVYADAQKLAQPFDADSQGGWRFWLPIICLLSGLRPNEVCQARLDDIKITALGTWYFDVVASDDDEDDNYDLAPKTLKTMTSRRQVPFHPELLKMGLQDFVDRRRKAGEVLLFPLTPDKYGNYAAYALKWLREYHLGKVLELGPRQSFYSLRHNFRDALRASETNPEVIGALGGWTKGERVTSDNYGSPLGPDALREAIGKLQFDGLDLSPLRIKSTVDGSLAQPG